MKSASAKELEDNFWLLTPSSEQVWKQILVTMQPYAGTFKIHKYFF